MSQHTALAQEPGERGPDHSGRRLAGLLFPLVLILLALLALAWAAAIILHPPDVVWADPPQITWAAHAPQPPASWGLLQCFAATQKTTRARSWEGNHGYSASSLEHLWHARPALC